MDDAPSGLELDTSRRVAKRPTPPPRPGVGGGVQGALRDPRPQPAPVRVDDPEAEPTDSSTSGAFIVITLAHLVLGWVLALQAPVGDALATLIVVVGGAALSFAAYYVTGFLVHHFGVIALVMFGGWFSLLVGFAAQLVHQLAPWLSWKVLAGVTAASFLLSLALDLR